MLTADKGSSANAAPVEKLSGSRLPLQLRWWVAAAVVAMYFLGLLDARGPLPLRFVAAAGVFIALYNGLFHIWRHRRADLLSCDSAYGERVALWQAAFDTAALTVLCLATGGPGSPFIVGFALLLAWFTATLGVRRAAVLNAVFIAALIAGAFSSAGGVWTANIVSATGSLLQSSAALGVAAVALFGIVLLTASIQRATHHQADECSRRLESEERINRKLKTLLASMQAIGSAHKLEDVLHTVTSEFAAVLQVKGVSVKLLSDDGARLHYAAACGLPAAFVHDSVIEVARSPLNKRVIHGEPFVTGQVTDRELFQFGEALTAAHIRSVLFLPLHIKQRVIGILGAYSEEADRFSQEDVDFFRLASGLVAIALENARAYEAVKTLNDEQAWFMRRVTHNLRAPLAAMLSILDVIRGGYFGGLNASQEEYLRRLDRRARTMLALVNELMTLARSRSQKKESDGAEFTDPAVLARRVRRTFQDEAAGKHIHFQLNLAGNLPPICGRLELVEQILENLISNALKYTPAEGKVTVALKASDGSAVIEVSDTGIGIPAAEKSKLFTEFFRASNAKSMEEVGTGLGLAIVKEIVEGLNGRMLVESEQNMGTVFVVHLPLAPPPAQRRTETRDE